MVKCPISITGVNAAEHIFGKGDESFRGNTVKVKPHQVHSTYIKIPIYIMDKYQYFTLSSDFMFFNCIPFFVTIVHHIKFIAALMNKDWSIKPVIGIIKEFKAQYTNWGFHIEEIQMDRQFDPSCG